MKRITSLLFATVVCTMVQAQYEIIPLPSSINIDAKGRTLNIEPSTPIVDKLNVDELQALIKALDKKPAQKVSPQLCRAAEQYSGNTEFRI